MKSKKHFVEADFEQKAVGISDNTGRMNMRTIRILLYIISIFSYIGESVSYFYLPSQIPIQWDTSWEISTWADKKYIFVLGLIPIMVLIGFQLFPKFDPRKQNYQKHARAYKILEVTLVLFMILLNWLSIAASFDNNIKVIRVVGPATIGILFIILGNYIPTLKSNFFFGIKNPWTLSDDTVWRKTHKAGGYLFMVIGLMMFIMAFMQNKIYGSITATALLVGIIGINVYSYYLFYKL